MKIDKTRPSHWLYLALFGVNVLAAMALRPFMRRRAPPRPRLVLYGHKLCGNLLAIHDHLRKHHIDEFDVVFLTMDPAYARELRAAGVTCLLALAPGCIGLLATAHAVISDHGLHSMALMVGRTGIKFFDVWHGFGFKGHNLDDFRVHRRYDEIWVASPLQARFYRERFGFDPERIRATGYARTDRLVHHDEDVMAIRRQLHLDGASTGKMVLYAPTWKQDDPSRSMYPFELSADAFLAGLSNLAQRTRSTVVIRAHFNTGVSQFDYPRVRWIPFAEYPDTEAILLASDILIADWSSIAFDWLLLNRPTVFLDVAPPFAHGHTLDATYRYGQLVQDFDGLCHALEQYVTDPATYRTTYGEKAAQIRTAVFGLYADGKAAQRCVERLTLALQRH